MYQFLCLFSPFKIHLGLHYNFSKKELCQYDKNSGVCSKTNFNCWLALLRLFFGYLYRRDSYKPYLVQLHAFRLFVCFII